MTAEETVKLDIKKNISTNIHVQSPTRIDLTGGFLDIWPVHALIKDCWTVNCSIPVFTSIRLRRVGADTGTHLSPKFLGGDKSPDKSLPLQERLRRVGADTGTHLKHNPQMEDKSPEWSLPLQERLRRVGADTGTHLKHNPQMEDKSPDKSLPLQERLRRVGADTGTHLKHNPQMEDKSPEWSLPLQESVRRINIEISSPSNLDKKSFVSWKELLKDPHPALSLLKKHIEYWGDFSPHSLKSEPLSPFNRAELSKPAEPSNAEEWTMVLKSESPVGGGLGASSSLCVSLAKVFCSVTGARLTNKELLFLCRDLETALLHAPAGTQDYIPALESEPNFMYIIEHSPLGPKWRRKKAPLDFFKDHLLLVGTGKSHHSGQNNWENLKKVMEKDQAFLKGLNHLKHNALKTVQLCGTENWPDLFSCLNREQNLREELFSNWITPHVRSVISLIRQKEARAVKLCGAGGGGSLMVLAKDKKNKQNIKQTCAKHDLPIILS